MLRTALRRGFKNGGRVAAGFTTSSLFFVVERTPKWSLFWLRGKGILIVIRESFEKVFRRGLVSLFVLKILSESGGNSHNKMSFFLS